MQNKNLIRFLESLVLLPFLTVSMPLQTVPKSALDTVSPQIVLSSQQNIGESGLVVYNQAIDQETQTLKAEADAIDAYFKAHDMPLSGTGLSMAEAADNNNLDWRLLPAIAVRESTGGKNACDKVNNNPFGWGSCKIGFDSIEQAIETVALNLGGNNPNTAKHYDNKTTKQILRAYNPPNIVPRYVNQVLSIMDDIGPADINNSTTSANS